MCPIQNYNWENLAKLICYHNYWFTFLLSNFKVKDRLNFTTHYYLPCPGIGRNRMKFMRAFRWLLEQRFNAVHTFFGSPSWISKFMTRSAYWSTKSEHSWLMVEGSLEQTIFRAFSMASLLRFSFRILSSSDITYSHSTHSTEASTFFAKRRNKSLLFHNSKYGKFLRTRCQWALMVIWVI